MNLEDIKMTKFPGGEVHVTLEAHFCNLFARITSSDDVMKLLMVTDAYKRMFGGKVFNLYLPYIPYARQDRVANIGEALSTKVFADLINSQNYPSVHVLDPHSDISTALINNVVVVDSTVFAKAVCKLATHILKEDYIYVAPDAGCLKKVHNIAKATGYHTEVIFCEKQRNTRTGKITGTKVHSDNIEGNNFIMWDDICDGGTTFVEIAKVLKAEGANKVVLATPHGIFSKGLDYVFEYIDEVYCTNSFKDIDASMPFTQLNYRELIVPYSEEDYKKQLRKAM